LAALRKPSALFSQQARFPSGRSALLLWQRSAALAGIKEYALLVIPLRATDDSFGAYHCGCREEALRVARSR
jgi:hypothetical protein